MRPLSDVRDDIYNDLKNAQATAWMDQMDREATVQILSPEFGGKKPELGK